MNFRTSHLVGLFATGLVAIAAPSINSVVAEPLKITGPDGQVKVNEQSVRQYGPTTSADTFWSIAQAVKPDNSVTVYQVMAALYDANPHAFSSKNYNSLERGMILLVPTKAVMQQTSQADAKARAERNDRNWSSANLVTKSTKPSVTVQAAAAKVESPKPGVLAKSPVAAKPNPLIAELSAEVDALTKQIEEIQAQNLELTDELARASDEIVVGSSDTEAFQQEIAQLKDENALLKKALQDSKSENEALNQELQLKQQQLGAFSSPKQEPTSDLWRTIMDNPLLLVAGAVLPALLVVALFWLFIRRRNENSAEEPQDEQQIAADKDVIAVDKEIDSDVAAKADDADDLAVHLDTDDTHSDDKPLQDIAVASAVRQAEEQDIVVEEALDEGQSLDDLWAEAMGEQEQGDEFNAGAKTAEEDDLDSLLAGFDEPEEDKAADANAAEEDLDSLLAGFDEPADTTDTKISAQEDDLDALLAGFDEPAAENDSAQKQAAEVEASTQDDDIDALLAGFDEPTEATAVTDVSAKDDDIDALLAGFDETAEATAVTDVSANDDDRDALLAGFDETAEAATETEVSGKDDDIDALLAGFDEPAEAAAETEVSGKDDDIDALLAGFDESPQQKVADVESAAGSEDDLDALLAELEGENKPKDDASEHKDIDSLSDEMAAELEAGFEIAAELELDQDSDTEKSESELDSELDALLADLEAPSVEPTAPLEPVEESSGDKIEPAPTKAQESNSLDFDLSDFDNASIKPSQDSEVSKVDSSEALLDFTLPDEEFDSKDSEVEVEQTPPPKSEKESGFFDDLKGNKKVEETSIDWESIVNQKDENSETTLDFDVTNGVSADLSDDELFKGLASEGSSQDIDLELADDDTFTLDDNNKLTVDEALAALDAEEASANSAGKSAVAMHDLTTFQKDNGFIDIDRLLSEADEDNGETDLYKELDVDMGDLNSLKGNTPMVDVDDEENSVNAKLDLARAYIEIDDSDSARALLKEVELDGNDRQQAEAAGLLKELV
ncbi:pilus assembly protein FimV [Shewanella schlegeliana]|uniref:Pilus assembly protein FimV n=1 Tax=Shewanella schlegeliana TaxID=190308 RepID=A0ABS1SX57_9GAMM|nr:FimV/HubP family polar landmark protein [Shewanella schlegeliana]MBL4913143.1 pilus assembly protein FimV [Shewanella schlegeliana]MCL1111157.1 pilus assembly protein FimV [Shewanella schlegeliana]GIU28058.1 pilus assembly protein FimV [Shewanella schlegeliana]